MSDEMGFGHFDKVLEPEKPQNELGKLDYLVHQTFKQSEAGQELLGLWKEALIMTPTVQPGAPIEAHGINEGQKQFIRNILITIDKVEGKL